MVSSITGFMIKQLESISYKVNIQHLIFDWNSKTYVETYATPKKWLKLAPRLKLNPLLPSTSLVKIG